MFCIHCGQELMEGDRFCTNCGAPVGGAGEGMASGAQTRYAGVKKSRKGWIAAIVGILILFIACAAFGIWMLFFSNTYKTPIRNLVKAIEEQDGEAAVKLIPEQYMEMADQWMGIGKEEMEDLVEAGLKNIAGGYQGDVKVDYEIGDVRDLSDQEIQSLETSYFGMLGEIEEAKEVEFSAEVSVNGGDDMEIADDTWITVIKIDGKWYLDPSLLN